MLMSFSFRYKFFWKILTSIIDATDILKYEV